MIRTKIINSLNVKLIYFVSFTLLSVFYPLDALANLSKQRVHTHQSFTQTTSSKSHKQTKAQQTQVKKQQAKKQKGNKYRADSPKKKVLKVYQQWSGTRYRFGGNSKSGIDCSAFVKKTMKMAFNISLPRGTSGQKTVGKVIPKKDLQAGDLIFFRKNHHVGVYIGDGKFVHSSTSRGVITSSLNEPYWHENYTQSRRVL